MNMDEQIAEIRATMLEIVAIQRKQAQLQREQAQHIADIGEQLDRTGHHLEVLVQISDGLIRDHVSGAKMRVLEGRIKDREGKQP